MFRTRFSRFILLVGLLCAAGSAFADTPTAGQSMPVALGLLQQLVLQVVVPLVATAILGLVTYLAGLLVSYLKTRWKITITGDQLARFDDLAARGIALAEEKAAAAAKAQTDKLSTLPFTGSQKLAVAVEFVAGQAQAAGLPAKSAAALADLVHAKLGATPGVGASVTLVAPVLTAGLAT